MLAAKVLPGLIGSRFCAIRPSASTFCFAAMKPQEVSADLERFCKIHLVFIFCAAFVNGRPRNDGGAEIMQDGTRPYFLYGVFLFLSVERFRA